MNMLREIKPLCLLVVEDNPGDYVLLQEYLKRSNLPVEKILLAPKMAEVPVLIKENFFDIALLDLSLPDSKGVDSVIILNRLLPHTPIIVFSGLATMEIAMESISLGAQDYLVKGEFDEKLLTKSIQYSLERKKSTEKLRESNERYEFINKATQETLWEWDYASNEGKWGEGMIRTFGYTADKLKYTVNWIDEYVHPDDKEALIKKLNICIISGLENWQHDYRFRCADGSYKNVYDRGFLLFDEQGKPYRMLGAMTDITEKKRLEKKLAEQQIKQQKLIIEATIQGQEKEKNQLGRELHDNINQILATVKLYLGMAMLGQNVQEDLVEKSYKYVIEAMDEIRKLSHSLVASSLGDIGLKEALKELVEDTNFLNHLHLSLSVDEKINKQGMDASKELMLYRIVQEQINNITKYAQAKEAVITLSTDKNNLFLSVADDGVGFDTSKKNKGIGLKNISSRVDLYCGHMNIISAPGKGCTLEVNIPH